MKGIRIIFGTAAAIALGLVGCKPGEEPAGQVNPAGDYELAEVDGMAVPAGISHEGVALKVLSGSFSIKEDGNCTSVTLFVPPSGQEVKREVSATWTQDGDALTFTWMGAGTTKATLAGDILTMNNEGIIFTYKKN